MYNRRVENSKAIRKLVKTCKHLHEHYHLLMIQPKSLLSTTVESHPLFLYRRPSYDHQLQSFPLRLSISKSYTAGLFRSLETCPPFPPHRKAAPDIPDYDPTALCNRSHQIAMNTESGRKMSKFEIFAGMKLIV